ncbi:MAG TPA: K(+)-transporting ATPase subunit C [Ruminococcaceae bacterium]|jgi:K+-transporting ATPase ATPase C chain|nr:K(+)-transporting ATPase subunit C [Oscillospiraceae bacterium]
MNKNMKILKPTLLCFLVMTVLCGAFYTAVVTGVAQLFFPHQANGSVITVTLRDGTTREYGSELIAQKFTKPQYLIGRPDGVTNLSPTGGKEKGLVQKRIEWLHSIDPDNRAAIPADLVTGSGSGVDPNISPAAAEYQAARIARARNMSADAVRAVIQKYTSGRFLGFLGEPAVNVLKVNLALDGLL